MKKDDPAFLKLTPLFHQPLHFFEKNGTPPPTPAPPSFVWKFRKLKPRFYKKGGSNYVYWVGIKRFAIAKCDLFVHYRDDKRNLILLFLR